jgi:hypothetical protein
VGNQTLAVEHLERAVEANAALGAPVWLAHARLDLAELLADKRRASELVEAAAATAAELQLPWVARRVEQLR